jgi:hypothetical protein
MRRNFSECGFGTTPTGVLYIPDRRSDPKEGRGVTPGSDLKVSLLPEEVKTGVSDFSLRKIEGDRHGLAG